ncbi:hypothetical protein HOP52_08530 [Halomonas campisalis]|uniref:Uncharacterized protein n=1 Tax=Billgrantia campisalis TaxID=74661 RepID=A0ABS9P7R3_9GAMM|nr:hypothetical protein [Halomonas campisalis]MCG6657798.1 hypothetical protein [Halomonas campisalis]MDR5864730.1 hypothetical protein [Halomonas campisalis]
MPVLVEATAVIIKAEAIEKRLEGGWTTFRDSVPTASFCSDDELVSVCLVDPDAVTRFANRLAELGLRFRWEGPFEDIAFADQKRGLITPCDWVSFETVNIGIGGTPPAVAICRRTGSHSHELRAPEGWRYQGSLSEAFGAEGSGPAASF